MDGTLLPGTTACLELAKRNNTLAELGEIEAKFGTGTYSTVEFARDIFELWGVLKPEVIRESFSGAPKLDNIHRVLREIRLRDCRSCLITMAPDYFAENFQEYGFDYIFASGFPPDPETPFDGTKILYPEDKPRIAQDVCNREGLDFSQTIAFGDSATDLPIFQKIKWSIAINASDAFAELAHFAYEGQCLWDAFQLFHESAEQAMTDRS
jgi:phosphoserine phosphatase